MTTTAAETAAKALDDAAKALRNLAKVSNLTIGDTVTDILDDLPVGAVVRDRDGDKYRKEATDFVSVRFGDRERTTTVQAYGPVVLVSLPSSPVTPSAFKIGDRVKISGLSIYGGNANGLIGKVTGVNTEADEITVLPESFGHGDKIYRSNQLTKVEDEPVSKNFNIERNRSKIRVEPSAVNRGGAFVHVSETDSYSSYGGSRSSAIQMTKDDTVKLIATLQAIVDA